MDYCREALVEKDAKQRQLLLNTRSRCSNIMQRQEILRLFTTARHHIPQVLAYCTAQPVIAIVAFLRWSYRDDERNRAMSRRDP